MTDKTSDDYRQEAAFQYGVYKPVSINMLYTDSLNMIAACKRNPEYCDIVIAWIADSIVHAGTQHEIDLYVRMVECIETVKANYN